MSDSLITAGITLSLIDKASAALAGAVSKHKSMLNGLGGTTSAYNERLLTQGNLALKQAQQYASIMRGASIGTGALIGAQVLNLNQFAKYEKGMAYISTLIDDTRFNYQAMGKEIMDISRRTGLDLADVQRAVYQAISSNIDPNVATNFISDISATALAGQVEIETAMNPVVTVLNSYGLEADKAMWVSDKLFQTVKLGRVEFNQLSDTVAEFAQTGALGGLAIEELLGAFATLTNVGITPAESATSINRFVLSIIDATDEALEFAKAKGLAFDMRHLQEVGIVEFLNEIQTATHGDIIEIQKLFPEIRAFRGVAPLVGSASDMFKEFSKSIYDASGTTARGAQKMTDTVDNKIQRLKQSWKTFMTSLGGVTADVVDGPLTELIDKLNQIQDNPQAIKGISTGLGTGTAILGGVAAVSGIGLVVKNITAMISAFKLALAGGGALTGGGMLANGAWAGGKLALGARGIMGTAIGGTAGAIGLAVTLTGAIMKGAGMIYDGLVSMDMKRTDKMVDALTGMSYQDFMKTKLGPQDANAQAILEGKSGGETGKLWELYTNEKDAIMKAEYFDMWKKAMDAREQAIEAARKEQEELFNHYRTLRASAQTGKFGNWFINTLFKGTMTRGKAIEQQEKANIDAQLVKGLTPEQKLLREKYKKDAESLKAFQQTQKNTNEIERQNNKRDVYQNLSNNTFFNNNKILLDQIRSTQPINLTLNLTLDGIAKAYKMEFGEIGYANGQQVSARKRQQIINAGGAVAI